MALMQRFAVASIAMFFVTVTAGPARALCVVALGSPSATPTATTLPPYDPFSTSDTVVDINLSITVPLVSVCSAALSFTRTGPVVMSQGASTLQYSIETASGQTLLQAMGYVANSSPASGNRKDFTVLLGVTAQVPVRIRVPAGQFVAAGNYSDPQLLLTVVGLTDLLGTLPGVLLTQPTFTPSIQVISKCVLPAPSSSTLDFTSAISNGHPNPGVVQSTVFNNVRCTAPSVLRLSGSAMQPVPTIAGQTGFDNFINWRAAGTFGNASTVLGTNSASQATSATKNTPSGATTNGTIGVDVNLLNGNPIIAGSYRGTLTVTIDPNL